MGLWGGCLGLRGVWWCWVSESLAAALKDPRCRWRVGGPLNRFSSFHTCTQVGHGLGLCVSSTPSLALHEAPQFYAPQSPQPSQGSQPGGERHHWGFACWLPILPGLATAEGRAL